MGLELAVAPSVRSPGLALKINLTAGQQSTGSAPVKALLIASKSTAGAITPDTQLVKALAGADDAAFWLGYGVPGHLAAKAIFNEYPLAQVDLVAPLESTGVQATGTFTFSGGPPTVSRIVTLTIAGRDVTISWDPGETPTQAATKAVAAINAIAALLPVVATSTAGVVTVTFKLKGDLGNDCTISVVVSGGAPLTAVCTASGANLTGGTLTANVDNVLSLVAGAEYDFILNAANGNTDATQASFTNSTGKVASFIDGHDSGYHAHLQQLIQGVTGTLSAAKVGSGQQNFKAMQWVFCAGGLSLPAEWAGAELGSRMRDESIKPNVNRIQQTYTRGYLFPPKDLTTGALTEPQVEDALLNGLTPITYDTSGLPRPDRPVTGYFKDSAGNPDARLVDVGGVSGIYAVGKDIRVSLPREFAGANLSKDLEEGDDPLPPMTVEERDIKAFVISRCRAFQRSGVVDKARLDKAIADGSLIVQVDPSDPSQCDIVLPLGIVPPLAKFSVVVNNVGPA